ncbi:MAG TPA: sigma-54 dependent transcriptional regulator [Phycisphaerae bacterium]|nr:sigma-54 dependent transcriptional regulator [Phycisphaerae bacterium]
MRLALLDVLIVDDEPSIRKMLAMWLDGGGHRVQSASTPADALALATKVSFDMAFVDLRLGVHSGLELVPELLKASPWLKIVVITAFASIDTAVEAVKKGAMDYLPKPFSTEQVDLLLRRVDELRQVEQKLAALEAAGGGTVGELNLDTRSPAMQKVLHRAQQVAKSEATVLIRGENGTGKGVIARLIHQWSPRAQGPFGVVSCPSLPPELLESELFGHVKGAFTGAVKDNPGRVSACEGGTLFLDEIGDLPPLLQPKLLRFIQDHEYEHVGEPVTRRANVRVITATNVDLEAAVKAGKFREDLFYRLNVVELRIPPLRDRPQDILPLAERFLAGFAIQNHKSLAGFTERTIQVMEDHVWPGNVRELRNTIERAVIFCEQPRVDVEHLGLEEAAGKLSPALGQRRSLEATEEAHIRHIVRTSASLEEAARVLDIDIATLWRKRRKYGI